MAESEQILWAYVKLENIAEIFSAWMDNDQPCQVLNNQSGIKIQLLH